MSPIPSTVGLAMERNLQLPGPPFSLLSANGRSGTDANVAVLNAPLQNILNCAKTAAASGV